MSPTSAARRQGAVAAFRNRRGEPASSFTATGAKKQFGRVLDMVLRGGAVIITKHDAPRAIMLSLDEFNALARASFASHRGRRPRPCHARDQQVVCRMGSCTGE
jgi:prevent-host-death family protein